jgi:hypothetical protein
MRDYVSRWFWWPTLAKDVKSFCKSCVICQTTKASTAKPKGLLHSLPILEAPWQSIAMDFVGPFPECMGYDYLLVVICCLTLLVHLIPMTTSMCATEVAWLFLKDIVRLHGLPETIVSDHDPKFVSKFWCELHRSNGCEIAVVNGVSPPDRHNGGACHQRSHRRFSDGVVTH